MKLENHRLPSGRNLLFWSIGVSFLVGLTFLVSACKPAGPEEGLFPAPNAPEPVYSAAWDSMLTKEIYYDKLLGMLAGAAPSNTPIATTT